MKKNCFLLFLLFCLPLYWAQKNVGINTTSPQATLHVKGSLRLEHPSQADGNALRVYKDGYAKWDHITPTPAIGSFTSNSGITAAPNTVARFYNAQITLSPGKWLVRLSLLVTPDNFWKNNNETILVQTYFSEASTSNTPTADYVGGSTRYISGTYYTPLEFSMVIGGVLLENKSAAAKTYYLWGSTRLNAADGTSFTTLKTFTANGWGENRIYAIPVK